MNNHIWNFLRTNRTLDSNHLSSRIVRCCPRVLGALLLAGAVTIAPTPVWAQQKAPETKAIAEVLFDQARTLLEQKEFVPACKLFEQSQQVAPGVGTLLFLAECYDLTNRLASSWAMFREAASAARAAGDMGRALDADHRANDLRTKVSELALLVSNADLRGLELLLDGRLISRAVYGLFVPVDAGEHELVVRAPGHITAILSVDLPSDGVRKEFTVPALQPHFVEPPPASINEVKVVVAPLVQPSALPRLAPTQTHPVSVDASPLPEVGSDQRLSGVVLGATGLVTVGVGVLLGVLARHSESQADEACKDVRDEIGRCGSKEGVRHSNSAQTRAYFANMAFGLGLASVGTAAWLYFSAPRQSATQPTALSFSPSVGAINGVHVQGTF